MPAVKTAGSKLPQLPLNQQQQQRQSKLNQYQRLRLLRSILRHGVPFMGAMGSTAMALMAWCIRLTGLRWHGQCGHTMWLPGRCSIGPLGFAWVRAFTCCMHTIYCNKIHRNHVVCVYIYVIFKEILREKQSTFKKLKNIKTETGVVK